MHTYTARIREIRLEAQSQAFWIECPAKAMPAPGQYLLASNAADVDVPLSTVLFPANYEKEAFFAVPQLDKAVKQAADPIRWVPGDELRLRGPLGHGFDLPYSVRRLALVDLDGGGLRLLPLVSLALINGADVALFSDEPPAMLPSSVEINPLRNLSEAVSWADFIAFDVSLEQVEKLTEFLGLTAGQHLPCPGQALVATPMPCGCVAECGACAVQVKHRWKLACLDGPVFNLRDLLNRG
jgi:NAD(P)H-flavin reductase